MVVEEEGGVKGCAGGCEMRICVCVLCSVGLLYQGMRLCSWYLFLRRVIIITGKETRNGPILSNSGAVFLSEHFGSSVPIGTLDLLLVLNLPNSTVMQNSVPKVLQREHCSRGAPTCFCVDGI
jgi:hypothetical protein